MLQPSRLAWFSAAAVAIAATVAAAAVAASGVSLSSAARVGPPLKHRVGAGFAAAPSCCCCSITCAAAEYLLLLQRPLRCSRLSAAAFVGSLLLSVGILRSNKALLLQQSCGSSVSVVATELLQRCCRVAAAELLQQPPTLSLVWLSPCQLPRGSSVNSSSSSSTPHAAAAAAAATITTAAGARGSFLFFAAPVDCSLRQA